MDAELMTILIVDDEDANVAILRSILQRAGYSQVVAIQEPRRAVERFREVAPDLVLLDYRMPGMTGLEVLAALKCEIGDAYLPILMLTADAREEIKEAALAGGARDFLAKPFRSTEVLLRIRNLLEARRFHLELRVQNERLEERVRERTRQLEDAELEMLVRLARAAEYRDDEDGKHVWRVARLSGLLARELELDPDQAGLLVRAARLHDVGKIAIPDGILLKPGRLSDAEFEVVRAHPRVGAQLLSGSRSPLIRMAEAVALSHHERWDGTGYPEGLSGDEIPLAARIVAVADAYDALTRDRAHQRARPPAAAASEIRSQAGRQFDPEVVAALERLYASGELEAGAE